MASRRARPPSGIALQHGLWEFSLHPDTHARSLSLLLGSRISRAGCPWGSTFPRRQKVPGSLLEPLTTPLHLPGPKWEPSGRPPYAPALGLLGPWSQLQAGSSSLRGPLPPTTSVTSNPPPLQFPQHSFPDTTQRRQGQ